MSFNPVINVMIMMQSMFSKGRVSNAQVSTGTIYWLMRKINQFYALIAKLSTRSNIKHV